jgi:hypothetical protein
MDNPAGAPVPRLIIAEGWDITVYSSLDALNTHLEPLDNLVRAAVKHTKWTRSLGRVQSVPSDAE